jgi:hypothetical protein
MYKLIVTTTRKTIETDNSIDIREFSIEQTYEDFGELLDAYKRKVIEEAEWVRSIDYTQINTQVRIMRNETILKQLRISNF